MYGARDMVDLLQVTWADGSRLGAGSDCGEEAATRPARSTPGAGARARRRASVSSIWRYSSAARTWPCAQQRRQVVEVPAQGRELGARCD